MKSGSNSAGVVRAFLLAFLFCMPVLGMAAQTLATGPFDADFVQERYLPGLAQPIVNRGHVHFGAGGDLRWEVTQPYHYVFAMDGKNAFEILPDGTKRAVDPAGKPWLDVVQRVLSGLLRGDEAELSRYFDITEMPGNGNTQRVTLTPRSQGLSESIERIDVTADAAHRARSIEITERSGARIRIAFQPDTGR